MQPFATDGFGRCLGDAGVENRRNIGARQHAASKTSEGIVRTRRRRKRQRLMLPMNHVGAGRMVPVHVAPNGGMRVVLKEHVVLATIKARRARIIHPVRARQQVKLRTKGIMHQLLAQLRGKFAARSSRLLQHIRESGPGPVRNCANRRGCQRGNKELATIHKSVLRGALHHAGPHPL